VTPTPTLFLVAPGGEIALRSVGASSNLDDELTSSIMLQLELLDP